ncbi:tautomerase family protein [Rhizobium leguminosarum]|uniref:tautomerase family protein n=1 Tax=Rhizobium leguminosarum TaxID=384 RepID=UPI001FEFDB96|nr:tautomerase family protein [Rhizobium leguminosarum]
MKEMTNATGKDPRLQRRSVDELQTLLDVTNDVVVEAFGVPRRDRYQILEEHERSHLQVLDTGLGMDRSKRFVLVESLKHRS